MFSNFGRGVLCTINCNSSPVSLNLPFQFYINRPKSCTTSCSLFKIATLSTVKTSNTRPVSLTDKHVNPFMHMPSSGSKGFGIGLSMLYGPRSVMSRNLCFFFYPFAQNCLLESNIPILSRLRPSSISCMEQRRYKTSKKSSKRPEYDSDSESDDEEPMQGTNIVRVRLQSLRTDGVLKKALNVARNKIEAAFYEGNIRVNGEKPTKKSHQLKIGDEVDLIRGVSPVNPDLLSISRVEILSVNKDDEKDELIIKIRRTKTLYIENYSTDSWKGGSSE